MNAIACTLVENDYHHGAAALANSLLEHGYRGRFWIGYRGSIPPWAGASFPVEDGHELQVCDGFFIRLVPLRGTEFISALKPEFMLELLGRRAPDAGAVLYFDADIVVLRRWAFFEDWVARGIALCEDRPPYGIMPQNRFHWAVWRDFAQRCGYRLHGAPTQHFNAGFVGVRKADMGFLRSWSRLMEALENHGTDFKTMRWKTSDAYPYIDSDQDALNVASAIGAWPLCTLGPEAMGFVPYCFEPRVVMSHAAGKIKPWKRRILLDTLSGWGPDHADREFWRCAAGPVRSFPSWQIQSKRSWLRCAALIGRIIGRSV